MRLADAEQARKALARIMNLYKTGDMEPDVFARLRPAFGVLLDYFKFEQGLDHEERIARLEEIKNGE